MHVSTDEYYASVARLHDPSLRARPVVVGYLSSRGSVVGASCEARTAGISAGMTINRARRLCPDAAFVPVDWDLCRRVSREIFTLADRCSPVVEPVRLDEGFIDYTGCSRLFGHANDRARRLQKEMAEKLQLRVSIGLAANKLVSRIASRAAKHGGLIDVPVGDERRFLADFPVGWLPGVGVSWERRFRALGVRTIGTLAAVPEAFIERVFGNFGRTLAARARGIDTRPVVAGGEGGTQGEIEATSVFGEDIVCARRLDAHLYALVEQVGRTLRRRGLGAKQIRLHFVYTDGFVVMHAARTARATALDRELYRAAEPLLERALRRRVRVRKVRISVPAAVPCSEQGDLFSPERERWVGLYQACDAIREKYGDGVVLQFGRTAILPASGSESGR